MRHRLWAEGQPCVPPSLHSSHPASRTYSWQLYPECADVRLRDCSIFYKRREHDRVNSVPSHFSWLWTHVCLRKLYLTKKRRAANFLRRHVSHICKHMIFWRWSQSRTFVVLLLLLMICSNKMKEVYRREMQRSLLGWDSAAALMWSYLNIINLIKICSSLQKRNSCGLLCIKLSE